MDFDPSSAYAVGQSGEGGLSSNFGKSPFPSLEVFIEAIARIGDVQGNMLHSRLDCVFTPDFYITPACSISAGKIRSWYYFADHGVVVYNISGNRFCENIGRPHKSNNGS